MHITMPHGQPGAAPADQACDVVREGDRLAGRFHRVDRSTGGSALPCLAVVTDPQRLPHAENPPFENVSKDHEDGAPLGGPGTRNHTINQHFYADVHFITHNYPATGEPQGQGPAPGASSNYSAATLADNLRKLESEVQDQQTLHRIREAVAQLQAQLDAWISEALTEKNARIKLSEQLRTAERKSNVKFWWGIGLGLPVGLMGSILSWLLGIN